MSYLEVYTVIEGGLDDDLVVKGDVIESGGAYEGQRYTDWRNALRCQAIDDGFEVDVFEIAHGHDSEDVPDGGCDCVQYLPDHRAAYTYGTKPDLDEAMASWLEDASVSELLEALDGAILVRLSELRERSSAIELWQADHTAVRGALLAIDPSHI